MPITALTAGSIQITGSTRYQTLVNRETSANRLMKQERGITPYNHWNQMATVAKAFNGLTAGTPELNKMSFGTSGTYANALAYRHRTPGSYGFYVQGTLALIAGSITWRPGFTRIAYPLSVFPSTPTGAHDCLATGPKGKFPTGCLVRRTASTRLHFQFYIDTGQELSGLAGTPAVFGKSTPIWTFITAIGR